MSLYLEIISGLQKGERYPLSSNLTIGRLSAGIQIDDAKISALHALVKLNSKGQMVLVDNDSANGILFNKKRVKLLPLARGIIFQLGRTYFQVKSLDHQVNPRPKQKAKPKDWKSSLTQLLLSTKIDYKNLNPHFKIFNPVIELHFVQGIQADTKWTLAYGPRQIGSNQLDLILLEPNAPDLCFVIDQKGPNLVFKTVHPKIIQINTCRVDEQALHNGDIISIGKTQIKVFFIKESLR